MAFVICLALALLMGALACILAGENPVLVYASIWDGSFGSFTSFGFTLYYTTAFIFSGLAVAVPYRVQLFNIGGEGQIAAAGLGVFAAYEVFHSWGVFGIPFCIVAGVLAGGSVAAMAGLLKAWRNSHEVITTILLNFIASALLSYFVLYVWKGTQSQNAETDVLISNLWLPSLGMGESPLNISFFLAILTSIGIWFFLEKTRWGFELKTCGSNPVAAEVAGYSVKKNLILAMFLGGALASGVAVNEILGGPHRLRAGMVAGFGFMGIAVAFLGRTSPLGILPAALFFAALFKGSSELEIDSEHLTKDFSTILQGLFLMALACEPFVRRLIVRRGRRIRDR